MTDENANKKRSNGNSCQINITIPKAAKAKLDQLAKEQSTDWEKKNANDVVRGILQAWFEEKQP